MAESRWRSPRPGEDYEDEEMLVTLRSEPPRHPIPKMQDAFEESLLEAMSEDPEAGMLPTSSDSVYRRKKLLENETYERTVAGRWRQKSGERFHPLWKLVAQISFGMHLLHQNLAKSEEEVMKLLQSHVDEIDGFLERTTADFELAQNDINERIQYLKMPIEHGDVFDSMLSDRGFRKAMIEGNEKIEHIVNRTSEALYDSLKDVQKGFDGTRELARYLRKLDRSWADRSDEHADVFGAMMGNTEGWSGAFVLLQSKGKKLRQSLMQLSGVIEEIQKRVGVASRRDIPQPHSHSPQSSVSNKERNGPLRSGGNSAAYSPRGDASPSRPSPNALIPRSGHSTKHSTSSAGAAEDKASEAGHEDKFSSSPSSSRSPRPLHHQHQRLDSAASRVSPSPLSSSPMEPASSAAITAKVSKRAGSLHGREASREYDRSRSPAAVLGTPSSRDSDLAKSPVSSSLQSARSAEHNHQHQHQHQHQHHQQGRAKSPLTLQRAKTPEEQHSRALAPTLQNSHQTARNSDGEDGHKSSAAVALAAAATAAATTATTPTSSSSAKLVQSQAHHVVEQRIPEGIKSESTSPRNMSEVSATPTTATIADLAAIASSPLQPLTTRERSVSSGTEKGHEKVASPPLSQRSHASPRPSGETLDRSERREEGATDGRSVSPETEPAMLEAEAEGSPEIELEQTQQPANVMVDTGELHEQNDLEREGSSDVSVSVISDAELVDITLPKSPIPFEAPAGRLAQPTEVGPIPEAHQQGKEEMGLASISDVAGSQQVNPPLLQSPETPAMPRDKAAQPTEPMAISEQPLEQPPAQAGPVTGSEFRPTPKTHSRRVSLSERTRSITRKLSLFGSSDKNNARKDKGKPKSSKTPTNADKSPLPISGTERPGTRLSQEQQPARPSQEQEQQQVHSQSANDVMSKKHASKRSLIRTSNGPHSPYDLDYLLRVTPSDTSSPRMTSGAASPTLPPPQSSDPLLVRSAPPGASRSIEPIIEGVPTEYKRSVSYDKGETVPDNKDDGRISEDLDDNRTAPEHQVIGGGGIQPEQKQGSDEEEEKEEEKDEEEEDTTTPIATRKPPATMLQEETRDENEIETKSERIPEPEIEPEPEPKPKPESPQQDEEENHGVEDDEDAGEEDDDDDDSDDDGDDELEPVVHRDVRPQVLLNLPSSMELDIMQDIDRVSTTKEESEAAAQPKEVEVAEPGAVLDQKEDMKEDKTDSREKDEKEGEDREKEEEEEEEEERESEEAEEDEVETSSEEIQEHQATQVHTPLGKVQATEIRVPRSISRSSSRNAADLPLRNYESIEDGAAESPPSVPKVNSIRISPSNRSSLTKSKTQSPILSALPPQPPPSGPLPSDPPSDAKRDSMLAFLSPTSSGRLSDSFVSPMSSNSAKPAPLRLTKATNVNEAGPKTAPPIGQIRPTTPPSPPKTADIEQSSLNAPEAVPPEKERAASESPPLAALTSATITGPEPDFPYDLGGDSETESTNPNRVSVHPELLERITAATSGSPKTSPSPSKSTSASPRKHEGGRSVDLTSPIPETAYSTRIPPPASMTSPGSSRLAAGSPRKSSAPLSLKLFPTPDERTKAQMAPGSPRFADFQQQGSSRSVSPLVSGMNAMDTQGQGRGLVSPPASAGDDKKRRGQVKKLFAAAKLSGKSILLRDRNSSSKGHRQSRSQNENETTNNGDYNGANTNVLSMTGMGPNPNGGAGSGEEGKEKSLGLGESKSAAPMASHFPPGTYDPYPPSARLPNPPSTARPAGPVGGDDLYHQHLQHPPPPPQQQQHQQQQFNLSQPPPHHHYYPHHAPSGSNVSAITSGSGRPGLGLGRSDSKLSSKASMSGTMTTSEAVATAATVSPIKPEDIPQRRSNNDEDDESRGGGAGAAGDGGGGGGGSGKETKSGWMRFGRRMAYETAVYHKNDPSS